MNIQGLFSGCPAIVLGFIIACGSEPANTPKHPAQSAQSSALQPPPKSSAKSPENVPPIEISIVGTTDLHGRLHSLPLFSSYVNAIRKKNPGSVVLVDSGDMFQGTLESNMNEGEAVIAAYRKIGYHAVAVGNHEFDFGAAGDDLAHLSQGSAPNPPARPDLRGALKARAAQAEGAFPFLAANLHEQAPPPPPWPNTKTSVLIPLENGLKIGIIGLSTIDTLTTTIAKNVEGMHILPLAKTIEKEADGLRTQGANIIVVATHAGGNCTQFENPQDLSSCKPGDELFRLVKDIPSGTVDVIFGGHTHKAVAHIHEGLPLLQAYANGKAFSRIDFQFDRNTKKRASFHIHPPTEIKEGAVYEGESIAPSAEIQGIIAPFIAKAEGKRSELVGITLAEIFPTQYTQESPLGNWIASTLLEIEPKADIALMNGGGIRTDLPAGPLRYGALYEVLPFDNLIAKATMSGQNLIDLFQKNLSGKHGILSAAGLWIEAECKQGTLSVRLFRGGKTKGREIKAADRLTIVTNDFLATRGDDGGAYENVQIEYDKPTMRDRIAQAFKKRGGTAKPSDWYNPKSPRLRLPEGGAAKCGANQ